MPKLPDCNRCLLYAHDPHLVCAVYPDGVEGRGCFDLDLNPDAPPEELWQSIGASYYKGGLILPRPD